MCIAVIAVADGLSARQTAAAIQAGPTHVDARPGYPDLAAAAGFGHVDVCDVTDAYMATLIALVREWDAASVEISRIVGADHLAERQATRQQTIRAVQAGLLRRWVIAATRPSRGS